MVLRTLKDLQRLFAFHADTLAYRANVPEAIVVAMLNNQPVPEEQAEKVLQALSRQFQQVYNLSNVEIKTAGDSMIQLSVSGIESVEIFPQPGQKITVIFLRNLKLQATLSPAREEVVIAAYIPYQNCVFLEQFTDPYAGGIVKYAIQVVIHGRAWVIHVAQRDVEFV